MKLLLDTHIFLWLSSVVSPWEIQIKQQLGKLHLQATLPELIETQVSRNDLNILPIELDHVYALNQLPRHHNDPFDRLLIAQARVESMVLVTIDRKISRYDLEIIGG